MRLNGWQRLWIIISAIYLFPIAFVAFVLDPGSEAQQFFKEFEKLEANENLTIELKREIARDKANARMRIEKVAPSFDKRSDKEFYKYLADRWGKLIDLEFDQTHKRFHVVGLASAFWLLSCALTYFMGYMIYWVRCGFRNQT